MMLMLASTFSSFIIKVKAAEITAACAFSVLFDVRESQIRYRSWVSHWLDDAFPPSGGHKRRSHYHGLCKRNRYISGLQRSRFLCADTEISAVLEHARSLTNKRKVLLGEMDRY